MPPAPPTAAYLQHYYHNHIHHHHHTVHHCCDPSVSDNSSAEVTPTIQAQGDTCWTLPATMCSMEARAPELYPLRYEPRRRIFGKMASNPFTKPANVQTTEPELSHVARWLDTIRLDDIEKYHEPL
ncbi:unnamed protein product [Cylicostephanus goldi]|uniref:Uncharacterized protein n=1 Tax=Cylicostephanus goldi TaxID=71465 RepID=A0A3P6R5M5_CYLGO|nr:unnamed protein product [Cylicostephanus goldi]